MTMWIVGGFQRAGTTMMMQALEAGGMHVWREENPGWRRDAYEILHPIRAGWPMQKYEGGLIKLLQDDILKIAPREDDDPYRIVFMRRHPDAMVQSWWEHSGHLSHHPALRYGGDVKGWMDHVEGALRKRSDCAVQTLTFEGVVMDPFRAFAGLRGFPVNIEAAADTVRRPEVIGAA